MSSYTNWQAGFKRRYGPFINPLPEENTLTDYSEFIRADWRPGENYNFPVKTGNEHGQTHNVDGSAFSINQAIDSTWENAQLDGAELLFAGNVPYNVIARSQNGAGPGNAGGAFWKAMDQKVEALMLSGVLYRELDILYGCGTAAAAAANLGAVSASISGANLAAPQVVTITRATWAPGIWNQLKNALVDVYQSDGTTLRENNVTVTSLTTPSQNRITLTKVGSTATVAAGDVIVVAGARTKSCYGVQAILENTGTLFNISASVNASWRAQTFSAGSATLTRAKIGQFASRMFPYGLTDGGTLFVSGATFADLAEEADALVRWTDSNSSGVKRQGDNVIEYRSPIGLIKVALHRYMKQSIAPFIANGVLKRVGSTDLAFQLEGTNDKFYLELPSNAGAQIRLYSHQAPVIEIPAHCGLITAISNNGDTSPS